MKDKGREWKRGYNWAKKYYEKFRSFKKREDGTYIGYKKDGGTEVIGSLEQHKASKGFYAGSYKAFKEAIKQKPTKTRKSTKKMKTTYKLKKIKYPTWKF